MEDYKLSELSLKKQMLVGKLIEPKLKKPNSVIIQLNEKAKKEPMLSDCKDQPYKLECVLCGIGFEEYFPKGIKKGDLLYIDRPFRDEDYINLNGELYIKISIHNVLAVRTPKKNPLTIN
jgi:hypothetical protein